MVYFCLLIAVSTYGPPFFILLVIIAVLSGLIANFPSRSFYNYAEDTSVGNMENVLITMYNSSIAAEVHLEAGEETVFYNYTCNSINNKSVKVKQTLQANISSLEIPSVPLKAYYLLTGSSIRYSFTILLKEGSEIPSQTTACIVELNIFSDYSQYALFLKNPNTLPLIKHCLSDDESMYTIKANITQFYFVALYILPEYYNNIKSITYNIDGILYYYDLTSKYATCVYTSVSDEPCSIVPTTTENTCIYAQTLPPEFTKVDYSFTIPNEQKLTNYIITICALSIVESLFLFVCMLWIKYFCMD